MSVVIIVPLFTSLEVALDVENDLPILKINNLPVASVQLNSTLLTIMPNVNGNREVIVAGEPLLSSDALMELNKQGIMVHTKM